MERYTVVVGNVGMVDNTDDYKQAFATFREYVNISVHNLGRAGNESVILFDGENIKASHFPTVSY